MALLTDAAYAFAAGVTMPIWLARLAATGKLRTDWPARFGRTQHWPRRPGRTRILLHAVSVGEVAAIRHLVAALEADPSCPELAISVTTDTGIARARALFGARHRVVRYPFDFGGAVRRFLRAIDPDAVALTELEVWPNFVSACRRRGIPVAVVNGRLSDRSFGRYRLARPFLRSTFKALSLAAVQSEPYAERFRAMGVHGERVRVEGTMKWDTAEIADSVAGADALAEAMGIDRSKPLVVAGSTAPGEEGAILAALPPGVQLLCAPRKPEWFDRAARALPGCVRRRSGGGGGGNASSGLFLLDSMGELRQAYALADVIVVGRTFGIGRRYGGSDMMEPVALGKATIVGPDTANFADTTDRLLAARALVRSSAEELGARLSALLADPNERSAMAARGRDVIRREQGASARTAELLLALAVRGHEHRDLAGASRAPRAVPVDVGERAHA